MKGDLYHDKAQEAFLTMDQRGLRNITSIKDMEQISPILLVLPTIILEEEYDVLLY